MTSSRLLRYLIWFFIATIVCLALRAIVSLLWSTYLYETPTVALNKWWLAALLVSICGAAGGSIARGPILKRVLFAWIFSTVFLLLWLGAQSNLNDIEITIELVSIHIASWSIPVLISNWVYFSRTSPAQATKDFQSENSDPV